MPSSQSCSTSTSFSSRESTAPTGSLLIKNTTLHYLLKNAHELGRSSLKSQIKRPRCKVGTHCSCHLLSLAPRRDSLAQRQPTCFTVVLSRSGQRPQSAGRDGEGVGESGLGLGKPPLSLCTATVPEGERTKPEASVVAGVTTECRCQRCSLTSRSAPGLGRVASFQEFSLCITTFIEQKANKNNDDTTIKK